MAETLTHVTGRSKPILLEGHQMIFYNQRSRDWTHPYPFGAEQENLSQAGCGIFSVCHVREWLTGEKCVPEELADFSCRSGGRDDTGTNRPGLLSAMEKTGLAREYGFSYHFDGLNNDLERLWEHMAEGGCALCNLRVGHIVALLAAREMEGRRAYLALDSYCESQDSRVMDHVLGTVPGTEVTYLRKNGLGIVTGAQTSYAAYWVDASLPKDFNYLHPIRA